MDGGVAGVRAVHEWLTGDGQSSCVFVSMSDRAVVYHNVFKVHPRRL